MSLISSMHHFSVHATIILHEHMDQTFCTVQSIEVILDNPRNILHGVSMLVGRQHLLLLMSLWHFTLPLFETLPVLLQTAGPDDIVRLTSQMIARLLHCVCSDADVLILHVCYHQTFPHYIVWCP